MTSKLCRTDRNINFLTFYSLDCYNRIAEKKRQKVKKRDKNIRSKVEKT